MLSAESLLESDELNPDDFMLLSGSANRAKSWFCEHCENWISIKNVIFVWIVTGHIRKSIHI